MASVNFYVRGISKYSKITCKFQKGRTTRISTTINIFVNPIHWDKKKQRIRNIASIKNRNSINNKLTELKLSIVNHYNESYVEGEIIDIDWLNKIVSNFFKRPKGESKDKSSIYFVDFTEWWLKEKTLTWLTSSNSYMSKRGISQYKSFIALVKKFENNSKIKLSSDANKKITNFVLWLHQEAYAQKTIERHVKRFKFFYQRAKEEGYKVDSSFEKRVFIPKTEEILDPFLNINEINKIFNAKMPNEALSNAKDNLIIACWTGLRVSDYLKQLDISNFIDDFIEIKTTKTKTRVTIPVHPMVKRILINRNGNLPKKTNESDFNKQIKSVCQIAGIKEIMKGRKFNSKTKRKVVGLYKKYELITSHIGRRSFATNHYGKLPNSVIMNVCGWSKEEMMLKYIKKTNREGAEILQAYWDKNFKTI